ncbi:hypothetical protein TW95_gp0657 [Pandoravirus inopinatum]|uniref:Uncharacterized protein n=1 Tax=Pandoravirus inopinatum TaxID=1605721 RepID=A0A0B5J979_9VIRU|nr:hypothetical protein TW95_gp0657 [Pandoravirus inopinatum]AJF97391.1 hypothetical protein [Pandoravirus inopinatum]
MTHVLYAVRDDGTITQSRVPLIEYARIGTTLGKSQPLRILLAAAVCTLKGLANVEIATDMEVEFGQFDDDAAYTLVEDYSVPITAGGTGSFTTLVDANLLPMLLDFDADGVALTFPARDLDSIRNLVEGPIPGDLPQVARQWYDWMTGLVDVLAETLPPIAARYQMILRGRRDYDDERSTEPFMAEAVDFEGSVQVGAIMSNADGEPFIDGNDDTAPYLCAFWPPSRCRRWRRPSGSTCHRDFCKNGPHCNREPAILLHDPFRMLSRRTNMP